MDAMAAAIIRQARHALILNVREEMRIPPTAHAIPLLGMVRIVANAALTPTTTRFLTAPRLEVPVATRTLPTLSVHRQPCLPFPRFLFLFMSCRKRESLPIRCRFERYGSVFVDGRCLCTKTRPVMHLHTWLQHLEITLNEKYHLNLNEWIMVLQSL